MFSLSKKSPPMVGLDISTTSVKLLELSRNDGSYRVESYAVVPLPSNAVQEKSLKDIETIGKAIRDAVRNSGSRAKIAAVAVPGAAAITKVITMPNSLSDSEIEIQIQYEAEQYIPYPLEEINLDFQTLGATSNSTTTIDVLLVASKSENIEDRLSAAEFGGLKTKVVDVESYAVEHAFSLFADQIENHGAGKTVAVVDIGATTTCLNVIFDRNLIYTREQSFGGIQLTEDIMRRYGLSYVDASRAKRNGGLPEDYESGVLEPFKQTVAQQVSRFLQFFFSASSHNGIDHVMLAGGCAAIPGINEFIQKHINTLTTVINPFASVQLAPNIQRQQLYADAPSLILATGLALRRFD